MTHVSLIKLLTSRLHCLLCSLLCMRLTPTTLHLLLWAFSRWHWQNMFFCKDDFFFFFFSKISTHYSTTVVGWREAARCLLHLPRDVRQVLLYTTAPQWSSSLLHGSEQVGGGWRGTAGGTRQGEVTLRCFTLNYSVKVLCGFLVALSRSTSFIMKSFMKCCKTETMSNEYRNVIVRCISIQISNVLFIYIEIFKIGIIIKVLYIAGYGLWTQHVLVDLFFCF